MRREWAVYRTSEEIEALMNLVTDAGVISPAEPLAEICESG